MSFAFSIIAVTLLYSTCASVASWACGRLRLVPVFHGMIIGTGAYLWAFIAQQNFSATASLSILVVISSIIGALALATSELAVGSEFSILSFSLQTVWFGFMINSVSLTRGPLGLAGVPSMLSVGGYSSGSTLILGLLLFGGWISFKHYLGSSSFMTEVAIVARSSELAWTLGLNSLGIRIQLGAVYGISLGLAGAILAGHISFINPDLFGITCSVNVLAISLLADQWGLQGSILGGFLIFTVPELARLGGLPLAQAGYFQLLASGCLIALGPLVGRLLNR